MKNNSSNKYSSKTLIRWEELIMVASSLVPWATHRLVSVLVSQPMKVVNSKMQPQNVAYWRKHFCQKCSSNNWTALVDPIHWTKIIDVHSRYDHRLSRRKLITQWLKSPCLSTRDEATLWEYIRQRCTSIFTGISLKRSGETTRYFTTMYLPRNTKTCK